MKERKNKLSVEFVFISTGHSTELKGEYKNVKIEKKNLFSTSVIYQSLRLKMANFLLGANKLGIANPCHPEHEHLYEN